jgi:hypothetical protein
MGQTSLLDCVGQATVSSAPGLRSTGSIDESRAGLSEGVCRVAVHGADSAQRAGKAITQTQL